jgi:Leucine-rich repeat (LRR) protein
MLAKMKHLRLLQLSYNHIAEIPENINEIQFLEELYIGDNGIKSIPDTVANLDQLRLLSVQPGYPSGVKLREPNQFSEFPTALLRMKGLRELAIARASITGFPKGITSELVALEKLDISKNPITALPGWLFPGSKMRNLVASHTSIRALPGCVTRWKHLEGLDLSFSNLEVLPEAIGQCKKLRELRVRGSKIDALPESIGDCEGLEVLDIARTKVREIPASLGLCWRLRELDMSETMVDTLPTSLGTCTNLECIKFRMLKDIPPEIEGLAGRYRKLRLDQDLDTARAAEYETRMRSIEQDEPEESDEEE